MQKLGLKKHLVPAIRAVLAGRSYVSQFDSRPSNIG